MQIEVELECRNCVKCKREFRVMTKSPQNVCSVACDKYGFPAPGVALQAWRRSGNSRETVIVKDTKPTRDIDKKKYYEARSNVFANRMLEKYKQGSTTMHTEMNEIKNESKMRGRIESEPLPTSEKTMLPTVKPELLPSENEETKEIQQGLSAELRLGIEKGALESINLLNKSGQRLMKLIEGSVNETDLEKAKDDIFKLEMHRVTGCVEAANALANTIQTQVNMLKVIATFTGKNK